MTINPLIVKHTILQKINTFKVSISGLSVQNLKLTDLGELKELEDSLKVFFFGYIELDLDITVLR